MKRIILCVMMLTWILNGQETKILWNSPVILGRVSAVDVNSKGIFISDRKQFSIFHLDKQGRLLKKIGARGEGPGEFRSLTDMAVNDKAIYVNDYASIKTFDMDGKFLSQKDMSKIGRFPRLTVGPDGLIFLGTPPHNEGDNATLFMKAFEEAEYNMFHYLPFKEDKLQGFGRALPQLKGQTAPVHIRNFYNIPYIYRDPYIYYVNNIEYSIWRIKRGQKKPQQLIKEDLPYFIPYQCQMKVSQKNGVTYTTTQKLDHTLIRLFTTPTGFYVYLNNKNANRLRHYRLKSDSLIFTQEFTNLPSDNILAYADNTFYGLTEDTLIAFRLN